MTNLLPLLSAGPIGLALALSLSLSLTGGYRAEAQQPSPSIIHQQIQPMNQPQNLIQGQNQTRSLMQNATNNQNQNQNQDQTQAPATNIFSAPALHGLDQNNAASMTESAAVSPQSAPLPGLAPGGSAPVESFFQIAPVVTPPTQKPHSTAYKILWHTLDNMGVPMFINHDPDIAPSLTRPFVMPQDAGDLTAAAGTPAHSKPTIIDPDAAAQDPSQMAPDDTSNASATSKSTSNQK